MDTDKLVENKILVLVARAAIIVATACLPVAGTMLWRIIDKLDDTSIKLQLLDQSVTFGIQSSKADFSNVRAQLGDHEGRIRLIERGSPPTIPR